MSELIRSSENTADAIIVGGGAVGLHTAHALHEQMGPDARILATTQESEWGGIAGRSLEQYRLFNDSYALAEIVGKGMKQYEDVNDQIDEQTFEKFPYIFTVGDSQRPEYIADLLPEDTLGRPDMGYYQKLKDDTELWGFSPDAHIVSADDLQARYPILNGNGIDEAMVVENCGRLHFDVMRNWLVEQSRADKNGRGVTYKARKMARHIIFGDSGEAIGVDFGGEKVYSDKIVLALGAFVVNLESLVPSDDSKRIADNFTVTQRELFFANTPGVSDEEEFFLITPDMAIARVSSSEGHGTYGYAAMDDAVIQTPDTNPKIDSTYVDEFGIRRDELFAGRTYAMLGECSDRWNQEQVGDLALKPFGTSAGYYTTYKDGMPVVGEIADTGVTLVAGSSHYGVMGGRGIAELAVDHLIGTENISEATHAQTDINRTPTAHVGLEL